MPKPEILTMPPPTIDRASVCTEAPPGERTWLRTINGEPSDIITERSPGARALADAEGLFGAQLQTRGNWQGYIEAGRLVWQVDIERSTS